MGMQRKLFLIAMIIVFASIGLLHQWKYVMMELGSRTGRREFNSREVNGNKRYLHHEEIDGLLNLDNDRRNGLKRVNHRNGMERVNHRNGMERVNHRNGMEKITPRHGMERVTHKHGMERVNHRNGMEKVTPRHGMERVTHGNRIDRVDDINGMERANHRNGVKRVAHRNGMEMVIHEAEEFYDKENNDNTEDYLDGPSTVDDQQTNYEDALDDGVLEMDGENNARDKLGKDTKYDTPSSVHRTMMKALGEGDGDNEMNHEDIVASINGRMTRDNPVDDVRSEGYKNEEYVADRQIAGGGEKQAVTRECLPEERVRAVKQYCDTHPGLDIKAGMTVRRLVSSLWVDDVNHVLMCVHAKAGSSSWKMILANNTSQHPVDESRGHIMIHGAMKRFNLRTLSHRSYSERDIKERLAKYYKFMVVRHPYDRLQSFFEDKFVTTHQWNHTLGERVMNAYHKDLPRQVRGRGSISFSDWIRWVEAGHEDDHWRGPYHKQCHPCLIQYDRIVKLETQDSDSSYIIRNKMRGRGLGTARNSYDHHKNVMLGAGKYLGDFRNCTRSQMEFLKRRLDVDLEMFGYNFDEYNMVAKCGFRNGCC